MRIEHRSHDYLESGFVFKNNIESRSNIEAHTIPDDGMRGAYRLRHNVFCEELGWVPCSESGLEQDVYDKYAEHFGVFKNAQVLSYLRLVAPDFRFMLEKEFSNLVSPTHVIRKSSDTREVSRLCVRIDERSTKISTSIGTVGVSMLLYRRVYQWCIESEVRYLYLVVEHKVLRLLKMFGFPCTLIGNPTRMPDGVVAAAALMDWREFESRNYEKRPELVDWFNQYPEFPDGLPLRRPEVGLQHQVSL